MTVWSEVSFPDRSKLWGLYLSRGMDEINPGEREQARVGVEFELTKSSETTARKRGCLAGRRWGNRLDMVIDWYDVVDYVAKVTMVTKWRRYYT